MHQNCSYKCYKKEDKLFGKKCQIWKVNKANRISIRSKQQFVRLDIYSYMKIQKFAATKTAQMFM